MYRTKICLSEIKKKVLDVNELKLDLPKVEPMFTKERTNVLGDSLMKGIREALIEQQNKVYKELIDKLGYAPLEVTIEEHPMKFKKNMDGEIEVSQDIKVNFDVNKGAKKMSEKYTIVREESKEFLGKTLYRIQALKDFAGIRKGEKGGYIQQYKNLSQYGGCWVYDDAIVSEDAVVLESARVSRNAVVSGDAIIRGNATVTDNAKVSYHATIEDGAYICDDAVIAGGATVSEHAWIVDNSYVTGNCQIKGNARIRGRSEVKGFAIVTGEASVSNSSILQNAKVIREAVVTDSTINGNATVGGDMLRVENANITGEAVVREAKDYLVMQNNWSSGRYFTYTRSNNLFKVGCFLGSGKELIEKAYKDSEEKGKFYKNAVEYVNSVYNLHEELENVEKYKNW